MLRFLLLLAATPIYPVSLQTPSTNPTQPVPPGVQIIGFSFGPGVKRVLSVENRGRGGGRSPELERKNDGDSARNTTANVMAGANPSSTPEASMSNDPYVGNAGAGQIFTTEPSSFAIAAEKGTVAAAIIRNTGAKTIRAIDWDFPYPHIRNHTAVLRYTVHTKIKIKPGESLPVRGFIPNSVKGFNQVHGNGPDRTVTFVSTSEGISVTVPIDSLRKGAQITRVIYSDGSSWNHQ